MLETSHINKKQTVHSTYCFVLTRKTYNYGSTGNCGSAPIENLLQSPQNKIHAYCRNKAKLQRLPQQVIDNKQVKIFEGNILDVGLIANCVRGTKAVFLVATTNVNVPGCHVSQDSVKSVINALEQIRTESSPEQELKLPKLVLLSSATIDDHVVRDRWLRSFLLAAASNIYDDLRVSEELLRYHSDWISSIFIKPGSLSVDVPRVHRLTLDEEESFLSYLDLSAGMIDAVNNEGRFGLNVGVVNKERGVGAKFPPGTPICLLTGFLRHFFLWLHPYLPSTGPTL